MSLTSPDPRRGSERLQAFTMTGPAHAEHSDTHPARRPSYRLSRWLGRKWARLNYAVRVEPTWLEVNRWDLPVTDLGHRFDGFRIVQLSDLHFGGHLPAEYVAESVASAQAESPDVVV